MKHVLLATAAALALSSRPRLRNRRPSRSASSAPSAARPRRSATTCAIRSRSASITLGRKLGGLPVEVIYEDDQIKPEVGVQKTQKLIESDKVDFLVGYIWSNVLLASLKPATDTKTFLITTNAGPSQIAGELCSPYVFSTSWVNDQRPAAVGTYLTKKGFKTCSRSRRTTPPAATRSAASSRTYKGKFVGKEFTRWPDQLDFSAELAKVRAVKPDAVFAFYPGAAGTQFLTQYIQAGLKGVIPLYTSSVVDEVSLPHQKELALGVFGVSQWGYDMDNPTNKRYVADYKAKTKTYPSDVWRADLRRGRADRQRHEGRQWRSLQEGRDAEGNGEGRFQVGARRFKFGKNHIPVQNFYLQTCREAERRLGDEDRRADRGRRRRQIRRQVQHAEVMD